eukprot:4382227-Prymnesium_polylepis.2
MNALACVAVTYDCRRHLCATGDEIGTRLLLVTIERRRRCWHVVVRALCVHISPLVDEHLQQMYVAVDGGVVQGVVEVDFCDIIATLLHQPTHFGQVATACQRGECLL